jgi:protein-disulfide isomerase
MGNRLWAGLLSLAVCFIAYGQFRTNSELRELRALVGPRAAPAGKAAGANKAAVPAAPLSLAGASIRGNRTAKIAVVEFSDFECPYCASFATRTLPALQKEFVDSGRVVFAYRHFPLDQIHTRARRAAQVTDCAGEQARFWEMHDRIFANPRQLSEKAFSEHAVALGLDTGRFGACLARSAPENISSDVALATRLGVTGTPTFFVGVVESDGQVVVRKRIGGAQSIQAFRQVIEEIEQGLLRPGATDGVQ